MSPRPGRSTPEPLAEHSFGGSTKTARLTVRKYALSNGLQVVLLPDHSAPVVAYQTWFRVGSRHEHAGKTGLAHLFEHLMFNETEHLKPGEFDRTLEAVGADTNAATWLDWTYYKENVPTAHLDLVMRLESDRMAHLVVHDPQVESERQVVASERRAHVEDDVDGFLAERLYEMAYTTHPYRSSTIGSMADILGITTEDARGFYRTYYAPNNATIVMVGDIVEDDVLGRLEAAYGAIEPSRIPPEPAVVEPPQGGERRARFAKEVAADRFLAGWHGCGLADPDHGPLAALVEILAGGPSSRLFRKLVIDTEIAAAVGMEAPEFRDPGLVEIRVSMQRGHRAEEAEAIIYEELASLARTPPSAAELERAKNCLETDHWRMLRHPEGKARALGHYETTVGDFRRLFEVAHDVRAVSAEDVRRAAERYFDASSRTVVVAEPERRAR